MKLSLIRITAATAAAFVFGLPGPARAQDSIIGVPAVVATVNGEKVTAEEWLARMQNMRAQEFFLSVNPVRLKTATGGHIALEALISSRLLTQYAAKVSLLPSDGEIEAELNTLRKRPDVAQGLEKKL